MSYVSFENIGVITPDEAKSMDGSVPPTPPLGSTTDSSRTNLYDPLWGYFTFTQRIDFQSNPGRRYRSVAQFVIRGTFTPTAEAKKAIPSLTDEQAFDLCTKKFQAIEDQFESVTTKPAPESFADWGTQNDSRCIQLPEPLRDRWGLPVLALPVSLNVLPGRWASGISYEAVLIEAIQPARKLKLSRPSTTGDGTVDVYLDNAQVSVTLPQPIIQAHRLVGCTGALLQISNYSPATYDISGSLPHIRTEPDMIGSEVQRFLSTQSGSITLSLDKRDKTNITLFGGGLDFDGGRIDSDFNGSEDRLTVRARAKF